MSYVSKVEQIYANEILLTSKTGTNVDIRCNTGEVLINGSDPSGGGASLPLIGTGNIEIDGLFESTGNITTTAGNMVASTGNVQLGTGNVVLSDGDVNVNGTGNITVNGSGGISVSTGGVTSVGDIETSSGDIVSAGDFIFEGNDIKHRTNNPVAVTSYVQYKQLPQLNANNTFTGANKFDDNVNEFSQKVSVGTRDAGGLFTQNLALNNSGNIESKTINNNTTINCGNITCDNGGTNSCAARTFTTRTSGAAGWVIEQQTAQGNALDNVLQIRGGQAGAYVTIVNSAFAGFVPNIVFDPQTEAEGGKIVTDNYTIGDSNPNMFAIKQPKTGVDSNNLIIQGSALDGSIKFQNNAGTTDLVIIEPDSTDGSGRIYCPALYFGTTGVHNSIVNDVSGAGNLNLKIRQATASSEVLFLDNADAEIIRVRKTQVEFGQNIPILFNNFSFRPQQYTFNFTGALIDDNPTGVLFNSHSTLWTNINDGGTSTLATIGNNFFKMTIIGVPDNSAGVYGNFRWSGDFPYLSPSFATGTVINRYDGNFSIIKAPSGFTKPDVCGFSSNSTDYKLCFPSVSAGTDTYSGTIRITILNT